MARRSHSRKTRVRNRTQINRTITIAKQVVNRTMSDATKELVSSATDQSSTLGEMANPVVFLINSIKYPRNLPHVYTDASFKDGIGAYSFLYLDPSTGFQYLETSLIPPEFLPYNSRGAELYSAYKAISYAASKLFENPQFTLHFDYVGVYTELQPRAGKDYISTWYASKVQPYIDNIYFHKVINPNPHLETVDTLSKLLVHNYLFLKSPTGDENVRRKQLISKGKTLAGL